MSSRNAGGRKSSSSWTPTGTRTTTTPWKSGGSKQQPSTSRPGNYGSGKSYASPTKSTVKGAVPKTKAVTAAQSSSSYYDLCRQCERKEETLKHILNGCPKNLSKMTKRHDEVVEQLVQKLPPHWDVKVDKKIEGSSSRRRPDIVITEAPSGAKRFVEISVPYDDTMETAKHKKSYKYLPEAYEQFVNLGGKKEVTQDTFIIGSKGTWDKNNDQVLSRLKIRPKARHELKEKLKLAVCKNSLEIYEEHIK